MSVHMCDSVVNLSTMMPDVVIGSDTPIQYDDGHHPQADGEFRSAELSVAHTIEHQSFSMGRYILFGTFIPYLAVGIASLSTNQTDVSILY